MNTTVNNMQLYPELKQQYKCIVKRPNAWNTHISVYLEKLGENYYMQIAGFYKSLVHYTYIVLGYSGCVSTIHYLNHMVTSWVHLQALLNFVNHPAYYWVILVVFLP